MILEMNCYSESGFNPSIHLQEFKSRNVNRPAYIPDARQITKVHAIPGLESIQVYTSYASIVYYYSTIGVIINLFYIILLYKY